MSDYKIEKKYSAPELSKLARNKFPFDKMEVGDSFYLGVDDVLRVRTASAWYGKRHNKMFTTRKHGDGYRCWRVE